MKMKLPFGVRFWVLIVALLLVAGGTIYGLSSTWQRVRQLEARLTSSQLESFQLAREVSRGLQNLNDSMLHYVLAREPQQWTQFEKASRDLDHWIDDHDYSLNPRSVLTTEPERQVFKEINRAYDDYVSAAQAVHSNALPALISSGQLTQLDVFNAQAGRMRELLRGLSDAHRAAQATFIGNATASLASLRTFLVASVVLLQVLVVAMGWVIYRDTIAPLRTKLVHSQHVLEKQEKLATLGTLAAGIAHEIRNPLTSVKARLYTLDKHLEVPALAHKDTEIISAEITRLENIVQGVLNFARPSEPELKTICAQNLLSEVHSLMASTLDDQRVQFTLEPGPDLFISADVSHLKQVLINLVRNAVEAIDTEGTITLRARSSRATLDERDTEAVILEVTDTGRGIPPEVEKRLFDPFFTTKETGTGLGLSVAARIVEKHGGVLQYQTRVGHGTTFGIVLPLLGSQASEKKPDVSTNA
jgi:signal transduction histidine kinase